MDDTSSDIAHLYRRAGFGASPADLEAAVSAGYQATVEAFIAGGGTATDSTGDTIAAPSFAPYRPLPGESATPEHLEAAVAQGRVLTAELAQLQAWWMERMVVTATPLREKMTLLWHGHFATSVSKVGFPNLMYLQNQLFRITGMGNFEDLTQAVTKGGAMMVWLDTIVDRKGKPNENFARELMELFTLGVGHYTQADVEQAARCFTGWTYDRMSDQWSVQSRQHDDGIKTFLGRTDNLSGEDAISTILAKPESARFVVAKVWSHLAYPVATTDPVVAQLAEAYAPSLNIADLLRAVFIHPAFRSRKARTGLVKQPIEYVVGALRSLNLDASGERLDPATGRPAPTVPPAKSYPTLAAGAAVSPAHWPRPNACGELFRGRPQTSDEPPRVGRSSPEPGGRRHLPADDTTPGCA